MARPERLDDQTLATLLADRVEWTRDDETLTRSLTFENFSAAFAFMTRVAMVAEQLNHHPEWSNVYNRVEVGITTHDAGGLTELDVQFIDEIEKILGS